MFVCVHVCEFTMLSLPVVVCRRCCVSLCMYLRVDMQMCVYVCMECLCVCLCVSVYMSVHVKLFLDSMCCGAVLVLVGLVVVSFMTLSALLWEECGRCVGT